jgi:hypothetical protein
MGPSGPDGPTQPISLANIGMSGLPGIRGTGTYKVVSAFVAVGTVRIYTFENVVNNNSAVQGIYRIVVSRAEGIPNLETRAFMIGELFIGPAVNVGGRRCITYILGPMNSRLGAIAATHEARGADFDIHIDVSGTALTHSTWIIQIQSPLLTQVLSIA